MSSEQDEKSRILKEARRVCVEQNEGLIVSDLLELGDGYVVVIGNPVVHGQEHQDPADALRAVTPSLMSIKGVKRVVVDILRKP